MIYGETSTEHSTKPGSSGINAVSIASTTNSLTTSILKRLDIIYANAQKLNASAWQITLEVYNKGSTDVTIDRVLINNRDFTDQVSRTLTVSAGDSTTLTITVTTGDGFSAGQNLQILVHTATGGSYPTQVVLP